MDWIMEQSHLLVTPSRPTSTGLQQQKIKWAPAPSGKIKLNALMHLLSRKIAQDRATGAIARNSGGSFLWVAECGYKLV
jgi:hypothetical protein